MNTTTLSSLLAVLGLLAAIFIFTSLRRSSRLQKRLFLLFLLLSLLPATLLVAANWKLSQRHLEVLNSPGLRGSLESALDLARRTLDDERERTRAIAQEILEQFEAGGPVPEPPAGGFYRFGQGEEAIVRVDAGGPVIPKSLPTGLGAVGGAARRLDMEGKPHLLIALSASEPSEPGLLLARPLDPDLAADLDAIAQGSSGVRQLRLVGRPLMRGDTLLTLGALTLTLLAVSMWLSRRLARRIAAPLAELVRGTRSVAAGDLDHRVQVDALDELGDLVSAFNRMTGDLKESKEELVRAERIAAWQGIARRLAHEIKNPLTPIGLSMHRIRTKADDPAVIECVETVLEETENLKRLADEFSLYARLPQPSKQELDLEALVRGVVELYVAKSKVELHWMGWPGSVRLLGDAGQLRQVFSNLVKNSMEAMSGQGRISIEFTTSDDELSISVLDDGPGLGEDVQSIFDPYRTSKETGTGLGLAIARKIVEDHGGQLVGRNREGGGACFTVILPRGDQS